MKLPKPSESDFELCPAGTHDAICVRIIDLGTQTAVYDGKPKHQHKLQLIWETPDELMDDGRPFTIGKRYTFSTYKNANLRKDLESWRGVKFADAEIETFDLAKLLGAPGQINVIHNDRGYADVVTIMRCKKGTKLPPPVNELIVFDMEEFDLTAYQKLSSHWQDTIAASPEYAKIVEDKPRTALDAANEALNTEPDNDEIPF